MRVFLIFAKHSNTIENMIHFYNNNMKTKQHLCMYITCSKATKCIPKPCWMDHTWIDEQLLYTLHISVNVCRIIVCVCYKFCRDIQLGFWLSNKIHTTLVFHKWTRIHIIHLAAMEFSDSITMPHPGMRQWRCGTARWQYETMCYFIIAHIICFHLSLM